MKVIERLISFNLFWKHIPMTALTLCQLVIICERMDAQAVSPNASTKTVKVNHDLSPLEDQRLSRPVSIPERSITLIDLMKELSLQTKISLSVSNKDGSGDERVSVFCKNTPLYKILNGVVALVSYRPGSWEWRSTLVQTERKFTLLETTSAKRFRESIRTELQTALEVDTQRMLDAVDESDDVKEAALKQMFKDVGPDFEKNEALSKDRIWADARNFRDLLSPEQRADVLRGDASIRIPFDKVSPQTRDLYLSENAEFQKLNGSKYKAGPIVFEPHNGYDGFPSVTVYVGNSTTASPIFGYGYSRSLDFYSKMKHQWIRNSDEETSQLENEVMNPKPTEPPVISKRILSDEELIKKFRAPKKRTDRLADSIESISKAVSFPVMARLFQDDGKWGGFGSVAMESVTEFKKKNVKWNNMMKWHDGVCLFAKATHLLEDRPVPEVVLSEFRKQAIPGEYIPFDLLCQFADFLTANQIRRQRYEYPMMDAMAKARGILQFCRRCPDLYDQMSKGRLMLTDDIAARMRPFFPYQFRKMMDDGVVRFATASLNTLRFNNGDGQKELSILFLNEVGQIKAEAKYNYSPLPKPEIPKSEPNPKPTPGE